ncbi:hypothetical protein PATA110616_06485 [Paenibacillus tarimensis]
MEQIGIQMLGRPEESINHGLQFNSLNASVLELKLVQVLCLTARDPFRGMLHEVVSDTGE